MCYPSGLAALGAHQHSVGDLNGHSFIDNAALASLTLRFHMLFYHIQTFHHNLIDLWHRPRNRPLLPLILSSEYQHGITLLDIHLGKVQWFFLLLLHCHFSSTVRRLSLAYSRTAKHQRRTFRLTDLVLTKGSSPCALLPA